MRKIRKLLLFIGLMMTMISCSNESNMHLNKSDLNKNIAENNGMTGNDYLKSITYSNLADGKIQNEVQEILKNSEISSQNINLFFQSVNYYNKKTENKDLIKSGFVNSQNINLIYDEAKIQIGVLVSEKNGKLLFIEKLAFQQPYQVLKFNNRTELNDYLMNKYDTAWRQLVARPFSMENDELLKEYRNNPNNK